MKLIVEKNTIFKALSHVQSIVEKKNTLPILSNILIEAKDNNITLSSTDMDISITEKINSNTIDNGSTTVNASTLYDIIRKLPENKEIEIISNDGKILSIRSGSSRFSLGCLPKEDFPIIDIENPGIKINIDSQTLLNLIDKTKFAISNEETRYFLNGLYFNLRNENNANIITIVGTDGHRLSKIDYLNENLPSESIGVIIPKKTINELSKLLAEYSGEIEINLTSNKIVFFINESILISKLIDGNFPDYKRVIPGENNNVLKLNRLNFSAAVDRVSTINSDKLPIVKLKLLNNIMNISTSNTDNGTATEDIETEYNGDEIEIGFNSKYVLDIVNNLEDEEIHLSFKDNSSPITATEKSNEKLIYVLMPMRI
tara:strand:- start:372 stop:1487 length:1116 start_codon:yes stop_codon:yes gene_type:complete